MNDTSAVSTWGLYGGAANPTAPLIVSLAYRQPGGGYRRLRSYADTAHNPSSGGDLLGGRYRFLSKTGNGVIWHSSNPALDSHRTGNLCRHAIHQLVAACPLAGDGVFPNEFEVLGDVAGVPGRWSISLVGAGMAALFARHRAHRRA